MENLESEIVEQSGSSEKNELSTTQSMLNSADPVQVVELVVEASKFVLYTGKEVVSSIAEHIDISF